MVNLVLVGSEFGNQLCQLPDGHYEIGRASGNGIIIDDPTVSKWHAELLVYGTELIVRERGSRNGTFVDGDRVANQSGVRPGQILRLGQVEMRVQFEIPDAELSTETSLCDYRRVWNTEPPSANLPIIVNRHALAASKAGLAIDPP